MSPQGETCSQLNFDLVTEKEICINERQKDKNNSMTYSLRHNLNLVNISGNSLSFTKEILIFII